MVHAIFLHPDLGIGGAERLIVDAGLALKSQGSTVSYFTNHHDKTHCFSETKDGTFPVGVMGDWIPRSIFGHCHAFFAYLRMLYLTAYVLLIIAPNERPDIIICDQIPIGIPLIKLFRHSVLFYCHFPDLLLSIPGGNLKSLYRAPINWVEEVSMSFADRILVNSLFTLSVFKSTFTKIRKAPIVLYPSINTKNFDYVTNNISTEESLLNFGEDSIVFLSINRYERKKNLGLAIRALQSLETIVSDAQFQQVHLLMMGGYDERVDENIEYFDELQQLCFNQKLMAKVTFLKSPSDEMKIAALHVCRCVLYTPENEHFGIVPLEAMYAKKAVIGIQSGGPTETVVHEKTGYLTDPIPEYFAHYMAKLVTDADLAKQMGCEGRKRFDSIFSFKAFTRNLNKIVDVIAQIK